MAVPRCRLPSEPPVVHRTARISVRLTPGQRRRCLGLLASGGDVWACVLELNAWRRHRRDAPLVRYQELCRELTSSGPGTFDELDVNGARSVLRRFSDAWFAAAKRRRAGTVAGFPRRRRRLMPVRWYRSTFEIEGRQVRIPTAATAPPLRLRLARDLPYRIDQVRSVTLVFEAGRVWLDVTAEIAVTSYPDEARPDPGRTAGVDLGIIHPYAVAGPDGEGLLVSGRAVRAEHRMHLADTKARQRAVARRAPSRGRRGSRRWRQYRRRARIVEARHRRRVRQTQHEAAKAVVSWAARRRIGTLRVGDPRDVLDIKAGRRHNLRLRQWRVGQAIRVLSDKAAAAGLAVELVDERGSSSTCPKCGRRIPKPAGRVLCCPHCRYLGHRDLVAAAIIATRSPGGGITTPVRTAEVVTHRRVGRHLPGAGRSRRDPRRPCPCRTVGGSVGPPWPAPPSGGESLVTSRGSTTRQDSCQVVVDSALRLSDAEGSFPPGCRFRAGSRR
jgi:putative transposase